VGSIAFVRRTPGAALLVAPVVGLLATLPARAVAYDFLTLQELAPNRFSGGEPHSWVDMIFLSFTILTGTGMGDISTSTGQAKSVVMVEQAVGLFYGAMVVTRLVGPRAMRRRA
jgi:hypothetical protein